MSQSISKKIITFSFKVVSKPVILSLRFAAHAFRTEEYVAAATFKTQNFSLMLLGPENYDSSFRYHQRQEFKNLSSNWRDPQTSMENLGFQKPWWQLSSLRSLVENLIVSKALAANLWPQKPRGQLKIPKNISGKSRISKVSPATRYCFGKNQWQNLGFRSLDVRVPKILSCILSLNTLK